MNLVILVSIGDIVSPCMGLSSRGVCGRGKAFEVLDAMDLHAMWSLCASSASCRWIQPKVDSSTTTHSVSDPSALSVEDCVDSLKSLAQLGFRRS